MKAWQFFLSDVMHMQGTGFCRSYMTKWCVNYICIICIMDTVHDVIDTYT